MARKVTRITVDHAIQLIDLIREQVRQTRSEPMKKILLTAGIRIADLALAGEAVPRSKAAA
jgi:hypothetical protein